MAKIIMSNVEVDYSLLIQLLDAGAACGYVLYRTLGALIFWSFGPQYYTQVIIFGSIILAYLLILWSILVCVWDVGVTSVWLPPCIWWFSRNSYTSTMLLGRAEVSPTQAMSIEIFRLYIYMYISAVHIVKEQWSLLPSQNNLLTIVRFEKLNCNFTVV